MTNPNPHEVGRRDQALNQAVLYYRDTDADPELIVGLAKVFDAFLVRGNGSALDQAVRFLLDTDVADPAVEIIEVATLFNDFISKGQDA